MSKKLYIFNNLQGLIYDKYAQMIPYCLFHSFNKLKINVSFNHLYKYNGLKVNTHIQNILLTDNILKNWNYLFKKDPDLNIDSYKIECEFNTFFKLYMKDHINIVNNVENVLKNLKNNDYNKISCFTNLNTVNTDLVKNYLEKNNIYFDNYITTDTFKYDIDNPHIIYKSMYENDISDIKNVILVTSFNDGIISGRKAGCTTIAVTNYSSHMDIFTHKSLNEYNLLKENYHPNSFQALGSYNRLYSEYLDKNKKINNLFQKYKPDYIVENIEDILYV